MNSKTKKILYIVAGCIAAVFLGYAGYLQIRLYIIYNKVSTVDEALNEVSKVNQQSPPLVSDSTSNTEVNDIMNSADSGEFGYGSDNTDQSNNELSSVTINGIDYIGDAATGIYYSEEGYMYDDYAQSVNVNGVNIAVTPDMITYNGNLQQ